MHTKFILLTDTHLTAHQRPLSGINPLTRLTLAIDHLLKHHADAAFVMLTGDLTDAGEILAYEDLLIQLNRLPFSAYLALGNHDDRRNFRHVFTDDRYRVDMDFVHYTFDCGGVRHIVLDTVQTGHSHGRLCHGRLQWLNQRLQKSGSNPSIIYLHHPPYDSGIKQMDDCRLIDADELAQVLMPYRNRILQIFHGHLHRDVHTVFSGIPVCGSRSTVHSIALQMGCDKPLAISQEPPGYTVALFDTQRVLIHHQGFLQGDELTAC